MIESVTLAGRLNLHIPLDEMIVRRADLGACVQQVSTNAGTPALSAYAKLLEDMIEAQLPLATCDKSDEFARGMLNGLLLARLLEPECVDFVKSTKKEKPQ